MSVSHRWFEWHLTPRGWIDGSHTMDSKEVTEKPTPEDTVATYVLNEYMGYSERPIKRSFALRTCNDQEALKALIVKYGEHPDGVTVE
jgi:hypothetical protein